MGDWESKVSEKNQKVTELQNEFQRRAERSSFASHRGLIDGPRRLLDSAMRRNQAWGMGLAKTKAFAGISWMTRVLLMACFWSLGISFAAAAEKTERKEEKSASLLNDYKSGI